MVLGTGQNKCPRNRTKKNHIESGFLHENTSAQTITIKIACEKLVFWVPLLIKQMDQMSYGHFG